MENAAPAGSEERASWNIQDWEAHYAKLENHDAWLQKAAHHLSSQGNATPFGSEQKCEWTTQEWEVNLAKLEKHVKKEEHQCVY